MTRSACSGAGTCAGFSSGSSNKRIARQPALLEVVRDWEARFLEDWRIGGEGQDPRLVHRVRLLAQEILKELSAELSPVPDGREMCM